MIARGSHSFTCHPLTNHTCFYSPAAGHHRPLAGTHCAYPWRDGQAELTWVISNDVVLETQVLVSRRLVSDSVLTSCSESCSCFGGHSSLAASALKCGIVLRCLENERWMSSSVLSPFCYCFHSCLVYIADAVGHIIGWASDLRFTGRGFQSRLGTTA